MEVITSTRNRQATIIAQNPSAIIITRITKESDGAGGWTTAPSTLDSQDIRIYSKRTRTLVIDEGGYHTVRVTKGVAKYDANVLKYGSNNEDKFTFMGKTYRIFDVIDQRVKGEIVFRELQLEDIT